MKKILPIGIIVMFVLASLPAFVVAHEKNSNNVVTSDYAFEIPIIESVDIGGSTYNRINMSDAPYSGNSGDPRLPSKGVYILLPQGTTAGEITVSYSEQVCLGSGLLVEPVGESVPLSEIDSNSSPVLNEAIYNSADMFPGKLYTKVGTYSFRGYEILVLKLNPVQYVPASGELFYYPDLMVSVKTIKTSNINSLYRGLEKDKLEVIKMVDNPAIADTYLETNSWPCTSESYDLLIITTDSLKEGFEPLAVAHNISGVRTVIKTLSEIGGTTPEDIRDYIKYAYSNWGIEYVLIGGDHDVVPARLFYFGDWYDEYGQHQHEFGPSDLYYSGLDAPSVPPGDLYEPNGSYCLYAEADSGQTSDDFVAGFFTPPLNLTGYSSVNLSFECSFKTDLLSTIIGKVNVYSGGTALDNFEENLSVMNEDYYGNIALTFDPSKYKDPGNVSIEFYYSDINHYSIGSFDIDDVCVEGINEKLILSEDFEGDVFPPTGWTQVKYSPRGEWSQEYYRFKADFLADVYVGRACVGDASEVKNFVDKTIAYMNTNASDPYLKKILMAGEYLGFFCVPGGKRLNELIGVCSKEGYKTVGFPRLKYNIQKLYDLNIFFENKLLMWKTSQIIKRINNNVHVINHEGHSDYDYNMRIYVPDVYNLTNDKYFFVYSHGCNAGGFDRNDCIAEYLTVKTKHGAFAGIWNARFGWFFSGSTDGQSQRYNREFWNAVFGENITVISKANEDSKVDNLWRINDSYMEWVCYGLNLLGDPAVQFKYLGSESNQNSQSIQQSSSLSQQNQQNSQQISQQGSNTQQSTILVQLRQAVNLVAQRLPLQAHLLQPADKYC